MEVLPLPDILASISSHRHPYNLYDFSSLVDICNALPFNDYILIHDSLLDSSCVHSLASLCREVIPIDVSPQIKDFSFITCLIDKLLSFGLTKSTHIICLGGGSLQDLVGTTCSLLYRGLSWTFIPSSPLSVADVALATKLQSIISNGTLMVIFIHLLLYI